MCFNNCLSICRHIITVCKCFLNIQYYTSNTALYTFNNTHSRRKKKSAVTVQHFLSDAETNSSLWVFVAEESIWLLWGKHWVSSLTVPLTVLLILLSNNYLGKRNVLSLQMMGPFQNTDKTHNAYSILNYSTHCRMNSH